MINQVRTIDFLPEVFRTPTNAQFLAASLDVLTSQPDLKRVEGFIGTKYGYGVEPTDKYVVEPTKTRADYQLDPSVVFLKKDTQTAQDFINYPGIIKALSNQGAVTANNNNLFDAEFYAWDSFVDLDKIVNYGQYYWIPNGPDAVKISSTDIYLKQEYDAINGPIGYEFANLNGVNPTISLLRGGTYTFRVSQDSAFWIQGAPGLTGYGAQKNLSTREVFGVTNNGASSGLITFTVPAKDAQSKYDVGGNLTVDVVTTLTYAQVNDQSLAEIDGVTDLNGKTLMFYSEDAAGPNDGFFYTIQQPGGIGTQITLVQGTAIANDQKITVAAGIEYIGRSFYKTFSNSEYAITIIPYISAVQDILYYQDGVEVNSVGMLKIVESNSTNVINVNDIIGKKNYISPNGVEFINGLKVEFDETVLPTSYRSQQYYVDGVGSAITLLAANEFMVFETPGKGLSTPWDSSLWDELTWDEILGVSVIPDYLTISRNSRDRNAWTRSNRWFNLEVINATIKYNGVLSTIAFNTASKAERPIIEFQGNLHLWNSGTSCAAIVDVVSFGDSNGQGGYTNTTNALKTVVGSSGYITSNGVPLTPGFKVLFPNDIDPIVRKTIYTVQFTPISSGLQVITLVPLVENIDDSQQTYVMYGDVDQVINVKTAGLALRSLAGFWVQAQLKTTINQPPLFNIFDKKGISLGDNLVYPDTNFVGTKLFSYTPGTGPDDGVLGFPIAYSGVTNIGDINFTVNMNSDTFTYTSAGTTVTDNISVGFAHWAPTSTGYIKRTGWVPAAAPSFQYQIFDFVATAEQRSSFVCDVPAVSQSATTWSTSQVYVNDTLLDNTEYELVIDTTAGTTIVALKVPTIADSKVTVLLYSDSVSKTAYYQVPDNLQSNPFNTNIESVDLGELRNQYRTIFGNTPGVSGKIFGQNNLYNLGDINKYGTAIIQNSASLVLPGVFLRKPELNLFQSLQFNSYQYVDYKQKLVDLTTQNDFSTQQTPAEMLDTVIYQISSNKNNSESFFWSDMLPSGSPYRVNSYDFNVFLSSTSFTLGRIYDFTSANFYGLAIYLTRTANGESYTIQLTRGVDYTVSTTTPGVTVTYGIEPGDTITVREYNQTYGSYCPNTPTKVGLYSAFIPAVVLDDTYRPATYFIKGHDGSYNKLFGPYDPVTKQLLDFRDQVLLEFETRVYNNLKVTGAIPLTAADVFPGQFRTTDYTNDEILQEYSTTFLRWVGTNLVDYKEQIFNAADEFTYNYNQTSNSIDGGQIQQGYWRGVYNWFYDTSNPANAPWEMLGLVNQPTWWNTRYGAAPYTSDNTYMWQDIANGYVWNNGNPYVDPLRVRPDLLKILPVDENGKLISPFVSVLGNYSQPTFNRNWVVGDQGPAETSYLRSSSWPFDLMRILALTKPVKFFNLFVDRDLYKFDADLGQYLYDGRAHLDPTDVVVYGNGTSKASYINWVVDFINQRGVDGTASVTDTLRNLDVRLTYNLAGFSAKNYLKFLIEKSTPTTQNSSLLIPDSSYSVLLYDNVPADRITYSSVIVQKTSVGWSIYGNSQENPYFTTVVPKPGPTNTISVGSTRVQISSDYYTDKTLTVAYGTTFYSMQGVSEFLVNYGRHLIDQGVRFDFAEGTIVYNWQQMVREFLYWSQQGWAVGSTISLNPDACEFSVLREGLVVQPLTVQQDNFILNQNLLPLQSQNAAIIRENSSFSVKVLSEGDTVALTNLNLSSIEHAVVFDNATVFNDTIYNLTTGLRQSRLLLSGYKSAAWNGFINASGFILNQDNVAEWAPNVKYAKGQIVTYKAQYWAANRLIEPSAEFFSEFWTATDYDQVKTGLLPNPSTNAYESLFYYDSYRANLENDADLLGFSLIGYRPRQYMADADLSDITQINVYKNIIREKGTNLIANAFKKANLVQGQIDYDVKENWAVKIGEFGGTSNSNFVEFEVSQSILTGNPALIGFSNDDTFVTGTQLTVQLDQLINYNRPPRTANFLPPYIGSYLFERGLPTAGYVNVNDAKFKTFDLIDLNDDATNIETFYRGDVIWVANYQNSWQVFSPETLNTQLTTVTNNLNGTVTLRFAQPHNLTKKAPFAIVNFDVAVNGFYTVKSVDSLTTLTIDLILDPNITVLTGNAAVFKLVSRRFSQASDQSNSIIVNSEFYTKLGWVDNTTGTNQWTVWKSSPAYAQLAAPPAPAGAQRYGTGVAYSIEAGVITIDSIGQVYRNGVIAAAVVSSAGGQIIVQDSTLWVSDPAADKVRSYSIVGTTFTETNEIALVNTGAIAIGTDAGTTWVYAGNTTTNSVNYTAIGGTVQIINGPANSNFGASIACSTDGVKLIVGAPAETVVSQTNAGRAYIYSRTSAGTLLLVRSTESPRPQNGALFGASVATNRYGAEMLVGAPFELSLPTGSISTEGAVYRFTNAGQQYGTITGTIATPLASAITVTIDGRVVTFAAGTTAASLATQIVNIPDSNLTATATGNSFTITTSPYTVDTPYNIIDFVASVADLATLGIALYTNTQVIVSPNALSTAQFGQSIAMNASDSLVIGAPAAAGQLETTFDFSDNLKADDTIFDNGATTFVDSFANSGAVFEFDYLPAYNESITNPGKYAYGQNVQRNTITNTGVAPGWGTSVAIADNTIVVGAPGWVSTLAGAGTGLVTQFTATKPETCWTVDKQPLPMVNVNGLNDIQLYDVITNETLDYLDYIDPVQGKLLGAVETNLDFIQSTNPANYTTGLVWTTAQVGKTWLDTTNLRMLNYNQPDVNYNASNWGRAFPGSTADIYTWVASPVEPVDYVGPGYVIDFENYTSSSSLDRSTNNMTTEYYFWVKNFSLVPPGKTLSPVTVSQYLLDPVSSGISYLTAPTTNIVAIYNTQGSVDGNTSVLHIGYGATGTDSDVIHSNWGLVQQDSATDFLNGLPTAPSDQPSGIYLKYLYSFAGQEPNGLSVPDNRLPPLARYGTSFRPRQSMFVNRADAISTYIEYANNVLKLWPITEMRNLTFLNTRLIVEATATDVLGNITVSTVEGLWVGQPIVFSGAVFGGIQAGATYYIKTVGINSITVSTSVSGQTLQLQAATGTMLGKLWDTRDYWQLIDWWAPGYSADTKIILEVATYTDLLRLTSGVLTTSTQGLLVTLENGLVARVAANKEGNSETWVYNEIDGWVRVGLTNGTIKILSTLYTQPAIGQPVLWIMRWLNEVVYSDELVINRNRSLILMFNYIQREALEQQNYLPWLNKTSLVDVSHRVRGLFQYKKFQRDNQDFLSGYLNEVKPYHVYIKDFSYIYDGFDVYSGNVTDFDLPAQYSVTTDSFVSPELVYQPTFEPNQYVMNTQGTGTITVAYNNIVVLGTDTKFTTELTPGTSFIYTEDGLLIGRVVAVSTDTLLTIESPSTLEVIDDAYQRTSSIWQQQQYSQWFQNYGLTLSSSELGTRTSTVLSEALLPNVYSAVVVSTTGLPQTGIITLDSEQMTYTSIDRVNNRLLGLLRAQAGTSQASHPTGTPVRIELPAVFIVDGARGYINPPRVTAYIDTLQYPYPRVAAELTATMALDSVLAINVLNPGSGYVTQPQIRIESSIVETFDSNAINLLDNTITIPGHGFLTGDPVVYTNGLDTTTPEGLVEYDYYYVYVVEAPIGVYNKIALYRTYRDAATAGTRRIDSARVKLKSKGTGNNHSLGVTAKASCFTNSQPIREFTPSLKFDRVTYRSTAAPWTQDTPYAAEFTRLPGTPAPVLNIVRVINTYQTTVDSYVLLELAPGVMSTGQLNGLPIVVTQGSNSRTYYAKTVSDTEIELYTNQSLMYAITPDDFSWYVTSTAGTVSVPTPIYVDASIVTYSGRLWRCIASNADSVFTVTNWQQLESSNELLTAADRIAGFYRPTANMPGRQLSQLMTGVEYPLATFQGPEFNYNSVWDVDAWDVNGWDNERTGLESYDTILDGNANVTAIYEVNGGQFSDGYGPEELVPGTVVDGMNMYVYTNRTTTAIGAEGFNVIRFRADIQYVGGEWVCDFSGKAVSPSTLLIYKVQDPVTGDNRYTPTNVGPGGTTGTNYTVDWVNKQIIFTNNPAINSYVLDVVLYEFGGNDLIELNNTDNTPLTPGGTEINLSDTILLSNLNTELCAVFKNGQPLYTGYVIEEIPGTSNVRIRFLTAQDPATDYISYGLTGTNSTGYSIPITQDIVGTAAQDYLLTGDFIDTANPIVELDGVRIFDGSTYSQVYDKDPNTTNLAYQLPTSSLATGGSTPVTGFDPLKVKVFILDPGTLTYIQVPQGVTTWSLNWDSTAVTGLDDEFYDATAPVGYLDSGVGLDSSRIYVVFEQAYFNGIPPEDGAIKIDYDTAQTGLYKIVDNPDNTATLTFNGVDVEDKLISVTSFNRDDKQNMLTQQFNIATSAPTTTLTLNQSVVLTSTDRLWVSVSPTPGYYIRPDLMSLSYEVSTRTNLLTINTPLNAGASVVVTSMGQSGAPVDTDFRLNVSQYGATNVYKINLQNSTVLTETTYSTDRMDDKLMVLDADRLVDLTQFTGVAVATVLGNKEITLTGLDISNKITMIHISQGGTKLNYSKIKFKYVGGRSNDVVVTLADAGVAGSVDVTVAQGCNVIVQSEQITFNEIVFDDTATFSGPGYITGLVRGQNTTITNRVFEATNLVQSVLAKDKLPDNGYGSTWYNIDGLPLSQQTTPAALFLKQ